MPPLPKRQGTKVPKCREVTTKTAAQIRRGANEIIQMADFLIAGGFRTEGQMLLDAAEKVAVTATTLEQKIDRYQQAVREMDP